MVHKFCFDLEPIIIFGLIENFEDIMMLVIFMMNGIILGYLILVIMESNNIRIWSYIVCLKFYV